MSKEALGNTLAALAVGVGVAEPVACAQESGLDESGGADAPVARPGPDSDVLPDGGFDVSGLFNEVKLSDGPASAFAASLVAREDTCMGSRSFGVQAAGFGVSLGTTWSDRQCRRVKNARQLHALGYREAAIQLLCQDRQVRKAMERANTSCDPAPFRAEVPEPITVTPAPEPPEAPVLANLDDVLFDFDRATLRPTAGRVLDPVLAMLKADPQMRLDIEGHTDWVGKDAYNKRLSERRASAVVDWFVSNGIARERLTSSGSGEAEPVASNTSAEGRQLNRRVELRRRDQPRLSSTNLPSTNLHSVDLPTL